MCGIVGYVGRGESTDALGTVKRLLGRLAHRGPDDAGLLVDGPGTSGGFTLDREGRRTPLPDAGRDSSNGSAAAPATVVFGHRRLAIIDTSSAGHQPMLTADGRYAIILNGEIYNYLELRNELEALGHRFRSRSDTEVLLAAYAEWGAACLAKLIGMFAFAVLDRQRRRLFLARDPFGMKPFFYTERDGQFVLASEISALLELPGISRRIDPLRLYDYLDRGITDFGDATLFASIRSLPAAHYAEVPLDAPRLTDPVCYWEPDLENESALSRTEAAAQLRDLFMESVMLHLRSDVRVGTNLSGGLDSSAIVMAMREIGGPQLDIHTFSYIGGEGTISEEHWIDVVNEASGAIPNKVHLEPGEWVRDFDQLIELQDEPFGTIAIYAQNRVFRRASEAGVRVVLNGQGADELLGGYRYLWAARVAEHVWRGQIGPVIRFLRDTSASREPWDPSTSRTAFKGLAMALPAGTVGGVVKLLGKAYRPWIDRAWCRNHGIPSRDLWWAGVGKQGIRHALWHSVHEKSLPTLLRYEDRNSMAFSVEGRLPFLTTKLAEFILALPTDYLVDSSGTSKAVFRAAMRGIVPDAVLDRRDKVGFAVPIQAWIPLIPGLPRLLEEAGTIPAVDSRTVERLVAAVRSGEPLTTFLSRFGPGEPLRNSLLVWRLVGLAAWAEHFEAQFD
ncbi:MAG: asparagine synthase (glutamine-hydrolyzing) [Gemmatimonadales bacterium]|nr:asparagine synthase (glutamine-hydrolyzing) [Gemmatimonadales bacterium]